ncbi:hypothetical protein K9L16_01565 [Candidatus Pacearchaeota archaeon]|nr:hypothetical protein [Candidatus Pacearchaeota archaeon]
MDYAEFHKRFNGKLKAGSLIRIFPKENPFKISEEERAKGDLYELALGELNEDINENPYLVAFNEFGEHIALPLAGIENIVIENLKTNSLNFFP